jgi:hypothetical protein
MAGELRNRTDSRVEVGSVREAVVPTDAEYPPLLSDIPAVVDGRQRRGACLGLTAGTSGGRSDQTVLRRNDEMPELSRFYGLTIRMYYDEHPPPHFHVSYQGVDAVGG